MTMSISTEAAKPPVPVAELARRIESELKDAAGGDSHLTADLVAQTIKATAAIDFGLSVGNLPIGLWNYYQALDATPVGIIIGLEEAQAAIRSAAA